MNSIEIKDLQFSYNQSKVLDISDLKIKNGQTVFLFGPSGSGKTTLLSLITGILTTRDGTLKVLGQDLPQLKTSERDHLRGNRMGYIFQMFNLLPYLSVIENILLPCKMNKARAARVNGDLESSASDLAERLGIGGLLHTKATELSVGQQQRVAAARALMGNPELIIADEPTSALDADYRATFLDLLFENTRKSGATIVFVSHDRSLAKMFDHTISLPEINRVVSSPTETKAVSRKKARTKS
ncbi:MAG: ABC transporter ATP-binding protein [Leptospirales bacterium]|nr:ABC transporter ATP-binding protein [Leptospirales bacterium]